MVYYYYYYFGVGRVRGLGAYRVRYERSLSVTTASLSGMTTTSLSSLTTTGDHWG